MTITAFQDLSPARTWNPDGHPVGWSNPSVRNLVAGIGLQAGLLAASLIALGLDDRQLFDISLWSKPIKFQTSLILLMATVLVLLPLLDARALAGRTLRYATAAIALTSTFEIAYITLQAARGRASHFNISTPIEAMAYQAMGFGAIMLVAACMVVGFLISRQGRADAPAGLRGGAAIGLMLGGFLTLITAMVLGSGTLSANSHWIGGLRSDAGGLFLLGWSRSGGDLRVPHFFATHLMQGLPILGLLIDRFAPGQVRAGLALGTIAGILVVAATFVQALMGISFL